MKYNYSILIFLLLLVNATFSASKNSLVGNLNLSQASFSNWTAGGSNTFSWLAALDGEFNQSKDHGAWRHLVKLSYGVSEVENEGAKKTADEIRLETLYTLKSKHHVNAYAGATLLTQFTESYDYSGSEKVAISSFMDPGYLTQSVGYGIQIDPQLKIRGGLALKETITSTYTNFSEGDTFLFQYGLEGVIEYKKQLNEHAKFKSKLDMFYAGTGLNNTDFFWDNQLTSKVLNSVQLVVSYKLKYDTDASPDIQRTNSLSVGIVYSFI